MSLRFRMHGQWRPRSVFWARWSVIIFAGFALGQFQPPPQQNLGISDCGRLSSLEGNVWTIDEEVIKLVEGDLQVIVDCAPPGGSLLLSVDTLELDKTLVLNRPITVSSTGAKVRVACPGNKTAVQIQSVGVSLADMSFEGCHLNGPSIVTLNPGSNATIRSALFVENVNEAGSGCISASNATLAIHFCQFSGNRGLGGGAVYVGENSTLSINGSYFGHNSAVKGGGVSAKNSDVNISDTYFVANRGSEKGGAIHVEAKDNGTAVMVENSTFIRNEIRIALQDSGGDASGGAIHAQGGGVSFRIVDSIFEENEAVAPGGLSVYWFKTGDLLLPIASNHKAAVDSAFAADWQLKETFERTDGGGAIAAVRINSFEMDQCRVHNNTVGSKGGGMILREVASASINNSTFTDNEAYDSGGLIAQADEMQKRVDLTVVDSIFRGNRGVNSSGGGLEIMGPIDAILRNLTFENNSAHGNGGGIFVYNNAHVNITFSRFIANIAGSSGGAVHFEYTDVNEWDIEEKAILTVDVEYSTFFKNIAGEVISGGGETRLRSLIGKGGGIAIVGAGTDVELRNSLIEECSASIGGGLLWDGGMKAYLWEVEFVRNSAALGGGLHAEFRDKVTDDFNLTSVNFTLNEAQLGGGLSLKGTMYSFGYFPSMDLDELKRVAEARNVSFRNNRATRRGGAVIVETAVFYCTYCNFAANHAGAKGAPHGSGGAIMMRTRGALHLFRSTIQDNVASAGGGIFVKNGVVKCTDVKLANNSATRAGGAVNLWFAGDETPGDGALMTCKNCSIVGNKASSGGGLYLLREEPMLNGTKHCADLGNTPKMAHLPQMDIFERAAKCRSVANYRELLLHRRVELYNTVFKTNPATKGGAHAIFTSYPEMVRICCGSNCTDLSRDVSLSGCNAQGKIGMAGSAGENRGRLISTPASKLLLQPAKLEDHRSGETLQNISASILDAFDQVISHPKLHLVVKAEDPDIISGNPVTGVSIRKGKSSIDGIRMTARPGTYKLNFTARAVDFKKRKPLQADLPVTIRNCQVGDVCDDKNCTRCRHCGEDLHGFDTSGECEACPAHANCSGLTLAPVDGFWHATSWSSAVEECFNRKACEFGGRLQGLQKNASDYHKQRSPLNWRDASYSQCSTGYAGPLCGSCASNYGRISARECGPCPSSRALSICLVLASFLALCLISGFLARDALKQAKAVGSTRRGRQDDESPSLEETVVEAAAAFPAGSVESLPSGSGDKSEGGPPYEQTSSNVETAKEHNVSHVEGVKRKAGETRPKKTRLVANRSTEVLKILINFLQVVGTAAAINANWNGSVLKIFGLADLFSGVSSGSGLLSFECAFSEGTVHRPVQSAFVQLFFPFGVWIVLATFWGMRKFSRKWDRKQLWRRFVVGFLVVLYVSYINVTKTVVRTQNCVPLKISTERSKTGTSLIWVSDTFMECYKGPHAALAGVGIFLFLAVVLGYPLCLILKLLSSKERLNDPDFVGTFGFLYKAYSESAVYWEALVLLRKALLATIVVFTEQLGPETQGTLASIVLFFGLALQNRFNPYDDAIFRLNTLESYSLAISQLVFFCGILFAQNSGKKGVRDFLAVVVIVPVVGFVLFAIYELGASGVERLEEWLEERGLPKKGSLFKDLRIACSYLWAVTREKAGGLVNCRKYWARSLTETSSNEEPSVRL